MNITLITLHNDNLYGTIRTCIPHGKDGQRVNDGRKTSFSKGGRPGVRYLRGNGETLVDAQDCTRGQTRETMAYQAKHTGQPQGERNANRREGITLTSVSSTDLSHTSVQPVSDRPCVALPCCHFTHTGPVLSTRSQYAFV